MPLGGLALQDMSGGSLKKAQRIVREALQRAPRQLGRHARRAPSTRSAGRGVRWRRLHQAARDYPLHVMHGYTDQPADGLDFLQLVERRTRRR